MTQISNYILLWFIKIYLKYTNKSLYKKGFNNKILAGVNELIKFVLFITMDAS